MADEFQLSEDPTSTWGASEGYKAAWNKEYGNVSPAAGAAKTEWVKFAVAQGKSESDAEAATRDELVAEYGAGVSVVAPAAKQVSTPGQGAGTSAEGNVASDPSVATATTGTAGTTGGSTR